MSEDLVPTEAGGEGKGVEEAAAWRPTTFVTALESFFFLKLGNLITCLTIT